MIRGSSILRRMAAMPANPACMLVLSFACAPRASLGRDGDDATESGTGTGGSSSSTSGVGTDTASSSTTTGADTGTPETSTGSDSSSTSMVDSTTAGDLCAPVVDDDVCLACRKHSCCDEWTACTDDEICTCIDTCITEGGDAVACETVHCAGPNDPWTHLHECSAAACAAEC